MSIVITDWRNSMNVIRQDRQFGRCDPAQGSARSAQSAGRRYLGDGREGDNLNLCRSHRRYGRFRAEDEDRPRADEEIRDGLSRAGEMTEFHSQEFVEALHAEQLRRHGGAPDCATQNARICALPAATKGGLWRARLRDLAAAYLFGIAQNHPFVDGNKRTAIGRRRLFLYFNGFTLKPSEEDLSSSSRWSPPAKSTKTGAAAFFRDHIEPIEG